MASPPRGPGQPSPPRPVEPPGSQTEPHLPPQASRPDPAATSTRTPHPGPPTTQPGDPKLKVLPPVGCVHRVQRRTKDWCGSASWKSAQGTSAWQSSCSPSALVVCQRPPRNQHRGRHRRALSSRHQSKPWAPASVLPNAASTSSLPVADTRADTGQRELAPGFQASANALICRRALSSRLSLRYNHRR
jgi:hypothetical protein